MMRRLAFALALLAHPVAAAPPPSPFTSVTASCVKLTPEREFYLGGVKRKTALALEVVTTYRNPDDTKVFARAVTPELAIGGRAADESRVTGRGTVTWWFYEPGALVAGEPLRYGMRGRGVDLGVRHATRCTP